MKNLENLDGWRGDVAGLGVNTAGWRVTQQGAGGPGVPGRFLPA